MAPLLKIISQLLPNLPTTPTGPIQIKSARNQPTLSEANHQQQIIDLKHTCEDNSYALDAADVALFSVSWGKDRVDVFRLEPGGNNLTHKFWDGHQWNPSGTDMETLGNGLATAPIAVTWGVDRLDVFGLDEHNVIKHQYWDGTAWRPRVTEFENLGGSCDPDYAISATTWGENRLDVFCIGFDGDLLHQYYDGSQWQPSAASLESLGGPQALGGPLTNGPSVVSWGKNRLDIFSTNQKGEVAHLYWDGSQWSKWELLDTSRHGFHVNPLTATSWGENRLDLFGVTAVENQLWHIYWDGSQWSPWELLDNDYQTFSGAGVASWGPNRLDIVVRRGVEGNYLYKFYDGQSWNPSPVNWYNKGPGHHFQGSYVRPSVVSWGENRVDIFGVDYNDDLVHQAWTGSAWYPSSTDWEILGHGRYDDKSPSGLRTAKTELRE